MADSNWISEVTGPGRSALHGVMIGGPAADQWLSDCFRGSGSSPHGTLHDEDGTVIDDVVLVEWPGETSRYLITCHGSPVLKEHIVDRFVQLGATPREPKMDLWGEGKGVGAGIAAQARISLPRACSREASAFLLEQASSLGLAGWIERVLETSPTDADLKHLLQSAASGIGVLDAPRVVIAGVPNAGKSTLFNELVGESRALTWHQPGTTRDLIESQAIFCGFPISLIDGAGIRQLGESVEETVEREGVRRMRLAMSSADLVLQLVPPSEGERRNRPLETPCRRSLVFHSRCDENSAGDVEYPRISTMTGEGIETLKVLVLQELYGVSQMPQGKPCLFLPSQRHWIEQALVAIEGGTDPRSILLNLAECI